MKRLLFPVVLLVVAFLFGSQEILVSHPHPTEASGSSSGAGTLVPANYDMELPQTNVGNPPVNSDFSQSSYLTGTPPSGYDFGTDPNCTLNGWTVSGTVSAQSGGPAGCYALIGAGGVTLTSAVFHVPADAQTLTYDISFVDGSNTYNIGAVQNGQYTPIAYAQSAPSTWTTTSFNFSQWTGQDVQLQFLFAGRFDLDNVGILHTILPGWTTPSGVPQLGSGGPDGQFAIVPTSSGGYTLTSSPFTVDSTAQTVSWSEKFLGVDSNLYNVYVLIPDGSGGWTPDTSVLALNHVAPTDWGQVSWNIAPWRGQTIKLAFYTDGTFGLDDIGVQHIVVQGWDINSWKTLPGSPPYPTLESNGPWGQYVELQNAGTITYDPLTIPGNAKNVTLEWKPITDGDTYYGIELTMIDDATGTTCDSQYAMVSAPGDWRLASFDVGSSGQSCPGKNVKLQLQGVGLVGVDNIAVNLAETARSGSDPAGEPVDTSSGAFMHQHTDLTIPGRGLPLEFTRYYSSQSDYNGSLGRNWSHTYETGLDIADNGDVTVRYAQGTTAYFTKSGSSYVAPNGIFDTLIKNGDGTYTLTTKEQIRYNYSSAGKLTSIVDRNNNTTTVSYNGNGYLASVTDSGERSLTFTTDTNGRITQIVDPLGRTLGFTYDGNGDLVTVTDVKGGESYFTYSGHRLLTITDSLGHTQTTSIYDAASRVVEQTDALGGKTCFYYGTPVGIYDQTYNCPALNPGPAAGQTTVVDPRGNATTYDYDTNFRTTKITDPLGGTIQYGYDANGNRNSVTDQNQHTTASTFDSMGNVLSRTDALNHTWTWTYNANNDPTLETDPLFRQVEYTYGDGKNLTRVRFLDQNGAELSRMTLARATNGDISSTTDGLSNTTNFGYDSYGNQTSATDPLTHQTTYTYDLGGRKLTETDPLTHTTTYTYDNQNNVLTTTDALNHTTTMTYDAKGNLSTSTDADGNQTTYHYDASDHLTQVVDALSHTIAYGYDANGNRTSETDANNKTTTYAYDALNRLTSATDPLSHATTYQYDAAGNQTQTTDAKGLVTKQFYDVVNRLTRVEHWDGGVTLVDSAAYGYDAKGNRTSVTDANNKVTSYTYDAMDRLSTVTDPNNKVTSYGYDANSNRTSLNDANHQSRQKQADHLRLRPPEPADQHPVPRRHYYVGYSTTPPAADTMIEPVTTSNGTT